MELDITGTLDEIDFGATGVKEILQNVRTILATARYSVPLDRKFGINAELLDSPIAAAKTKLTADIITAIHQYEPRAQVTSVTYSGDGLDGTLIPKVRVKIKHA